MKNIDKTDEESLRMDEEMILKFKQIMSLGGVFTLSENKGLFSYSYSLNGDTFTNPHPYDSMERVIFLLFYGLKTKSMFKSHEKNPTTTTK